MISQLTGTVLSRFEQVIVIDVAGVGYQVELSLRALPMCSELGQTLSIATYLAVREDAMKLYGFIDASERETFLLLLKISGIGPKNALAIISHISPQQLFQAVKSGNMQTLTKLPGIGKKSAERMILELQDKIPSNLIVETPADGDTFNGANNSVVTQVEKALIALGYKPKEAERLANMAVQRSSSQEVDLPQIIKIALSLR